MTAQNDSHIAEYMQSVGQQAKKSATLLASADTAQKNTALNAIAAALIDNQTAICTANAVDLAEGKVKGLDAALIDRLALNPERIEAMATGLRQIAELADPVGAITDLNYRPSGIQVGKMRMPIGVIGIIYESRPNVTADAAALCLKSGNSVILRGGSEALHSNLAIAECIALGLKTAGLPKDCVQIINTPDRAVVGQLITSPQYVDIIIPRGGKNLIARVSAEATVPVIKHLDGICHVYIDDNADTEKAIEVAYNAKARRYGVCSSMETLLIAESQLGTVLPPLAKRYQDKGIELRCCPKTAEWVKDSKAATEEDWHTEYLGPVLSIRAVDGLDQAIEHINHYGSHHTDSIVTENLSRSRRFLREVDSSSVMVNTSTQFADGFEYGLGAEIGISTDKIHVRGPVGLEGLTCQKYVVFGNGHTRP